MEPRLICRQCHAKWFLPASRAGEALPTCCAACSGELVRYVGPGAPAYAPPADSPQPRRAQQ